MVGAVEVVDGSCAADGASAVATIECVAIACETDGSVAEFAAAAVDAIAVSASVALRCAASDAVVRCEVRGSCCSSCCYCRGSITRGACSSGCCGC